MSIFDFFKRKPDIPYSGNDTTYPHEFCPRCEANLTLQKGYSSDLPYWVCKGCGEMLINPNVDDDGNIAWICDGCREMLNTQPGFKDNNGEWKCTKCGFVNKIDPSEVYKSDDEYKEALNNPYRGMSDEDVLKLNLREAYQAKEEKDRRDRFFTRIGKIMVISYGILCIAIISTFLLHIV